MSGSNTGGNTEKRLRGLGIAEGIAHGPVVMHWDEEEEIPVRDISHEELPGEIARFESALIATRAELLEIQEKIARSLGAEDAGIFDAHLLVVEDRTLIEEVLRLLEKERKNVEHVFHVVASRYAKSLEEIDDPYLRERVVDIHDVSRRVIRNLLGRGPRDLATSDQPHILVARTLAPSDTALLDRSKVLGFVTEAGSKTSHAAIMARSLGIPAVAGIHQLFGLLETGDEVLVDGSAGLLILHPRRETIEEFRRVGERRGRVVEELVKFRETPSATSDGRRIVLSANIELPSEMAAVAEHGAEGVGLFRTEYLFLNRTDPPSEDEQFESCRIVAERARPHPVIIRTLDLGGDKMPKAVAMPAEENPFLGCRAVRFCFEHPEIFKPQLRAILRAAAHLPNIRLMYPMISSLAELRRANALLEECREELRSEGVPCADSLEVGIMVEVPGAALCADHLARECSFFSIGTNDLIQYTLAADRVNDRVSHLFDPAHPAVLRLIRRVVEAGRAAGIWTGVCGEMAGEVSLTPLLLGLGIEELSVSPRAVPRVKRAIQALSMPVCEALAREVLEMDSSPAILARCEETAMAYYGELFG
ncbi:MAG: phosphoenolpyruvate--protein phosphotransferase [Terrimicrobiaceae bacterium]|nr:phosphoenolpyruvate--protein phosphotransferase [Terrimicrobiaceae bacterium]